MTAGHVSKNSLQDRVAQHYKIRMAGLLFRRSIEITQNATRVPKRRSQALKSVSNQMAYFRLAMRGRGKIGDKCLVVRLRFAVMREIWF